MIKLIKSAAITIVSYAIAAAILFWLFKPTRSTRG